ncbi:MAG: prepilin-type N-terminal cleavage/methylation domain-containing protein [Thiomicrorhabdus sp.]|nr:prepilin-type N-terminal cleavage/methylation domain-containing protein [Thiomicrorhabdus sp.]
MINLKKQQGFTLVELAVVLAVVAALVVGSATLFSEQKVNVDRDVSQVKLATVKVALLRFMEKNDYLPCPDTNDEGEPGFGTENRFNALATLTVTSVSVATCSKNSGTVPFEMLDLSLMDVKDTNKTLFHYAVTQGVSVANDIANCPQDSACFFNRNIAPAFNFSTEPIVGNLGAKNLELCAGTNCSGSNLLGRGIVALVVAYNDRATASTLSSEERENQDGDATFIQLRAPTESFDDLLISISGHELKRNEAREFRESEANVNVNQNFDGNDMLKMGDNSLGDSGTNVGTDNVTWDRVNQVFDFGEAAANQEILLTYKTRAVGTWDQPSSPSSNVTSDTATVASNGTTIEEYKYDFTDNTQDGVQAVSFVAGFTGNLVTRDVNGNAITISIVKGQTYNSYADYWVEEREFILQTDATGKIDLEFAVGTTATYETIDFTDIELMYYNAPPPVPDFPGVSPIFGIIQTDGLE